MNDRAGGTGAASTDGAPLGQTVGLTNLPPVMRHSSYRIDASPKTDLQALLNEGAGGHSRPSFRCRRQTITGLAGGENKADALSRRRCIFFRSCGAGLKKLRHDDDILLPQQIYIAVGAALPPGLAAGIPFSPPFDIIKEAAGRTAAGLRRVPCRPGGISGVWTGTVDKAERKDPSPFRGLLSKLMSAQPPASRPD